MDHRKDEDTAQELNGSVLGTKEYWDQFYKRETENFQETGDTGEVWFGLASMRRIVNFMSNHVFDKHTPILELGCGNGLLLQELAQENYADLSGVDFSEEAVSLARLTTSKHCHVLYETGDVLDVKSASCLQRKYNVVIDKGTYDAVSLCPDGVAESRRQYIHNCHSLLNEGGLCIITSCNWTSVELTGHFTDKGLFKLKANLPVAQMSYGGHTGQTVCCLVFEAL